MLFRGKNGGVPLQSYCMDCLHVDEFIVLKVCKQR